jgi:glycosyltransferase involved in cell wall biosynthesis
LNEETLHIFAIDFPYKNGEPFLLQELDILSTRFKKIIIFPLDLSSGRSIYSLPKNVEVAHFNIFSPYNRVKMLLNNFFFVTGVFVGEFIHSSNRWSYISNGVTHLNVLLSRINAAKQLSKVLPQKNKVLAYTYWFNQWTFILSILNKKQGNISLVTRIHGMDVYEEQHSETNFFFPFRYFQEKHIKKVLSISSNGKDHFLKRSPQFQRKTETQRLGVKDHGLNPINSDSEFILVSCSAFQKYKRVHFIPELIRDIKFPMKWIHFGDGDERRKVEEKISGLPSHIKVELRGHVSPDELMDFYANNPVDLFINVSETEGIPVSIMEAMSFGIPCLAPNVGGIGEIVSEKNGYLMEGNFKKESFTSTLSKFAARSIEEKQILRKNARETWQKNYDVTANTLHLLTNFN